MEPNDRIWKTKLAAWTHDPMEKALVLLRDPAGHEGGTVAAIRSIVFPDGISSEVAEVIKRADHWASASDRPQWPRSVEQKWADEVRFYREPVIIHPLSGEEFSIRDLGDTDVGKIKQDSFDLLKGYIAEDQDPKKTLLAFWRFASASPPEGLGALWSVLPADTRAPDHTIWQHLDLTSAFAGAMAVDPNRTPALLIMSFGPVQEFIANARTTSDLWSGSHLLSRIAWEGLKVICERFGPDAVIFPQLRGVPFVDVWLQREVGLPSEWFKECEWQKGATDANPLFAAALPNKFLAVVPSGEAETVAAAVSEVVRDFVMGKGRQVLERILHEIKHTPTGTEPCFQQLEAQLAEFPEVHWVSVPWSLIRQGNNLDTAALEEAAKKFDPNGGFAGNPDGVWKRVLSGEIEVEGAKFYSPNPGVLYPAIYELAERVFAAAKAIRPFSQSRQEGYRSSLDGEREWLTLDRSQLDLPPGKRQGTLWTKLHKEKRSWVKNGEHLDALSALKRLWPTLFAEEVEQILNKDLMLRITQRVHLNPNEAVATSVILDRPF